MVARIAPYNTKKCIRYSQEIRRKAWLSINFVWTTCRLIIFFLTLTCIHSWICLSRRRICEDPDDWYLGHRTPIIDSITLIIKRNVTIWCSVLANNLEHPSYFHNEQLVNSIVTKAGQFRPLRSSAALTECSIPAGWSSHSHHKCRPFYFGWTVSKFIDWKMWSTRLVATSTASSPNGRFFSQFVKHQL